MSTENVRYCLRIKINATDYRVYSVGLMLFDVKIGPQRDFTPKFINKPYFMITKYESEYDKVSIDSHWKEFDQLIRKNFKNTISNHFSLYNMIFKKVLSDYYYGGKGENSSPLFELKKTHKNISDLFNDIEEQIGKSLSNIWHVYKTASSRVEEVMVKVEEIREPLPTLADEPAADTSLLGGETEEGNTQKTAIDWGLDENTAIVNYSPVISVSEGIVARNISIGDSIMVRKTELNEASDSSDKARVSARVIQKLIDANNNLRFLVITENDAFGDVEIYDDLIKIRTSKASGSNQISEDAKEEKLINQASLLIFNSIVVIVVLALILYFIFK